MFQLPMSAAAQDTLEAFLTSEEQKAPTNQCVRQTCIGGVSYALSRAQQDGCSLWPIFPTLVAVYLVCRRSFHAQERSIQYIGPTSLARNLVSLQVALEVTGVLTLLVLVFEAIYFGIMHARA